MKKLNIIAVITFVVSLTGCSAYKAGQTPDDVYFSPGKVLQPKEDVEYQEYQAYNDDQYLNMKVQNNNLWSTIDDYDYWYDSRYAFGLNYYSSSFMYYGYNNFYSPYYSYYLNPYSYYEYGGWGMYNPVYVAAYYKNPTISRNYYTSASNISAYKNKGYNSALNSGYKVINPSTDLPNNRFNPFSNGSNYRSQNTQQPSNTTTQGSWSNPVRTSSGNTTGNTGGASGGTRSTGSSAGGNRSGRN